VTEKYAGKGLEVIAINIVAKQDDQVVPFLSENRYTFTPYKATPEMLQAYGVRGAPTEYVIDRQGRAVAMVRLNSDERERQFEQLVERLLGS
jgi:hypothetical protein